MEFKEADEYMKESNAKARRTSWSCQFTKYIKRGYGCYNNSDGGVFSLSPEDIDATDWEIVEEREDLCYLTKEWVNKQKIFTEDMQEELFEIIRTKNKEFIKWLNTTPDHIPDYIGQRDKKAKEIFGEELI